MMRPLTLWALAISAASAASPIGAFKCLVAFGDSYTDEGRGNYFVSHGQAPPVGTTFPVNNTPTNTGGYTWGQFAAVVNNATYFDYAVQGSMCDPKIVPRNFGSAPFPDVLGYQMSTYEQEVKNATLYQGCTPANTVYALWIGTNDLGYGGYMGYAQSNNYNITTFINSIWTVFDRIWNAGGRRFVLFEMSPLDIAPAYATPGQYGYANTKYTANPMAYNTTDYVERIREYTTSVNTMFEYGVPYQLLVKNRYPGCTFSVFNATGLMKDIYYNPGPYLSAPAIVNAPYRNCATNPCTDSTQNPRSAYLW